VTQPPAHSTPAAPGRTPRPVLVVDFGAQYAQLIARRVREASVYSEIVPHTATVEQLLAKDPAAIILSGGPASVYADGAPSVDPALFDAGVPVLGICYGFQAMALALGGSVARTGSSEFGGTAVAIAADGKVYFFSEDGKATVIEAGRAFKILAENTLPEGFMASPAVDGRALYLRTKSHLYRIENPRP